MANHYWIKLYSDILHNPRMVRLDDSTWRHAVEMFVLAGELGHKGRLGVLEDIAFHLRCEEGELEDALNKLGALGVVHEEEGEWIVSNFAERQAPSSSSQRVKTHRERRKEAGLFSDIVPVGEDGSLIYEENDTMQGKTAQKNVTECNGGCNEDVTGGNGDETKPAAAMKRFPSASAYASASVSESASASESGSASVSDIEESGMDSHPEPFPEALNWLTPQARQELRECLSGVPPEWVTDAIREAQRYNAKSPEYIKAILERWQAEGRDPPPRKVSKKSQSTSSDPRRYLEDGFIDFIVH